MAFEHLHQKVVDEYPQVLGWFDSVDVKWGPIENNCWAYGLEVFPYLVYDCPKVAHSIAIWKMAPTQNMSLKKKRTYSWRWVAQPVPTWFMDVCSANTSRTKPLMSEMVGLGHRQEPLERWIQRWLAEMSISKLVMCTTQKEKLWGTSEIVREIFDSLKSPADVNSNWNSQGKKPAWVGIVQVVLFFLGQSNSRKEHFDWQICSHD